MSDQPQTSPEMLTNLMGMIANTFSDDEAMARYQALMERLPPDAAAQLNAMAFDRLPAADRRQLAAQFQAADRDASRPFHGFAFSDLDEAAQPLNLGKMAQQAALEDRPLSDGVMGGNNSALGSPLVKFALAALAIYVLNRLRADQQTTAAAGQGDVLNSMLGALLSGMLSQGGTAQGGGDPLGQVLGGLLGGAAQSRQAPPQSADPLGQILGGLLGGATQSRQVPPQSADPLGQILGGLLGGAAQGRQSQESADPLGQVLGSLLGGAAQGQPGKLDLSDLKIGIEHTRKEQE